MSHQSPHAAFDFCAATPLEVVANIEAAVRHDGPPCAEPCDMTS